MESNITDRIMVRDAHEGDVFALVAIKGHGSEALHRDRLREAHRERFRYLVLLSGPELVGFACLVFERPESWSDAKDKAHLPQIVDLQVAGSHRGRGLGSGFIRHLEIITAGAGYKHLYISVDPLNNPRADSLYRRLGYQPLQSEPYKKVWEFTDSGGQRHHGEDWSLDLVKQLA